MKTKYIYIFAALVLIFTFVPWLGETLFNTKGEPREAIVAVSILQHGDWILPTSCGGDIPYKPPMLAWLIAGFSWLFGGTVSEFTSRLPSALAAIILALCTMRYFAQRAGLAVGAMVAAIMVTSFEVFRAAGVCRVDMLLTMFMVVSIFMMAKDKPKFSVWPILLMSGAVMTKGPIGMILPCFIVWIYFVLRHERFWLTTAKIAMMGVLALVLPGLWYFAAAHQGGDEFVRLALEENIGRLTGNMAYESHNNPFYYNFISIIAGMAPYTLLILLGAWGRRFHKTERLQPVTLLSIIASVVIIGFYCIPSSKRSVYLLPAYPFLAYFVVLVIKWLMTKRHRPLKIYAGIIGVLTLILPLALLGMKFLPLDNLSGKLGEYVGIIKAWNFNIITWFLIFIALDVAYMLFKSLRGKNLNKIVVLMFAATFALYWNISATASPAVLNAKSDRGLAEELRAIAPGQEVKSFIDDNYLRYYTTGFYLHDSITSFRGEPVSDGTVLITGEKDKLKFDALYGSRFQVDTLKIMDKKSCDTRQRTLILKLNNP